MAPEIEGASTPAASTEQSRWGLPYRRTIVARTLIVPEPRTAPPAEPPEEETFTLQGTVLNGNDHQPVEGATVELWGPQEHLTEGGQPVEPDESGMTWCLRAAGWEGSRWDVWERKVKPVVGSRMKWFDFRKGAPHYNPRLRQSGFRFTDRGSYRLPTPSPRQPLLRRTATTDGSGSFTLEGIKPGARYELRVTKEGFTSLHKDVPILRDQERPRLMITEQIPKLVSHFPNFDRLDEKVRQVVEKAFSLLGDDHDVYQALEGAEQEKCLGHAFEADPGHRLHKTLTSADVVRLAWEAAELDLEWMSYDPTESNNQGPHVPNYFRPWLPGADPRHQDEVPLRLVPDPADALPGDAVIRWSGDLQGAAIAHVGIYVGEFSGNDRSGVQYLPGNYPDVVAGAPDPDFLPPPGEGMERSIPEGIIGVQLAPLLEDQALDHVAIVRHTDLHALLPGAAPVVNPATDFDPRQGVAGLAGSGETPPEDYKNLEVVVDVDPDAEKAFDDQVTAVSPDGQDQQTLQVVSDGELLEDGRYKVVFTQLPPHDSYRIRFDPGAEGEPYYLGSVGGGGAQPQPGLAAGEEGLEGAAPDQSQGTTEVSFSNARWSVEVARVGDTVEAQVDVMGIADGETVTLRVMERDTGSEDDPVTTLQGTVSGGTAKAEWGYVYDEDVDDTATTDQERRLGSTVPEYYFYAEAGESRSEDSGILGFRDTVTVEFKDEDGAPLTGYRFELTFPDGVTKTEGMLDDAGKAEVDDVPPGEYRVRLLQPEGEGSGAGPDTGSGSPDGGGGAGAAAGSGIAAGVGADATQAPSEAAGQLTNPAWSAEEARVGDTVELTVRATGFAEGAEVEFHIKEHDADGQHDDVAILRGAIQGGQAKAEWSYVYDEDVDDLETSALERKLGTTVPEYFFVAQVGEVASEQSAILEFRDSVNFEFVDDQDQPLAGWEWVLTFPDGQTTKEGVLDAQGKGELDGVPPGEYRVRVAPPSGDPQGAGGAGSGASSNAGIADAGPDQQTEEPPAGSLTDPTWSAEEARVGDEVTLQVNASGFSDGTEVSFRIKERDADGQHDDVAVVRGPVQGGKAEARWGYVYDEDVDDLETSELERKLGTTVPEYFFVASAEGVDSPDSQVLNFRDMVSFEFKDQSGQPLAGRGYRLTFPDGRTEEGTLDEAGKGAEDGVPPGEYRIELLPE